jgi:hypothetical protein
LPRQRVFKYASKWDFVAYGAGVLASIGAGITLPLMNVVFGELLPTPKEREPKFFHGVHGTRVLRQSLGKFVGNFSSFANFSAGGAGINKSDFESKLNQLA